MGRWNRGKVQRNFKAALNSRAGFGERHRDRFLHEIIKDGRYGASKDSRNKASSKERAHDVSPILVTF
jgi:hypothetical protein